MEYLFSRFLKIQLFGNFKKVSTLPLILQESMISCIDFTKIFILIFLFMVCIFSGIETFVIPSFANEKLSERILTPQFAVCDTYSKDIDDCKNVVRIAYDDINIKCKGYIKNLISCKEKGGLCRAHESNVAGCTNILLNFHIKQWKRHLQA